MKKGSWMPEEDVILAYYVQEHGPGNWKYVPVNTGLMRCGKSCRRRWTNYLRPGIRRGNFTRHEEDIIVRLQSLVGNSWSVIASYLPQRTDNDVKNHWNIHLSKKLKNRQAIGAIFVPPHSSELVSPTVPAISNDARHVDHHTITTNPLSKEGNYARPTCINNHQGDVPRQLIARQLTAPASSLDAGFSSSSSYASSMDNISKLLHGFMKKSTMPQNNDGADIRPSASEVNCPLLCIEQNVSADGGAPLPTFADDVHTPQPVLMERQPKQQQEEAHAPLSPIENWLLDDEAAELVANLMELSDGCCSAPMLF